MWTWSLLRRKHSSRGSPYRDQPLNGEINEHMKHAPDPEEGGTGHSEKFPRVAHTLARA